MYLVQRLLILIRRINEFKPTGCFRNCGTTGQKMILTRRNDSASKEKKEQIFFSFKASFKFENLLNPIIKDK